MKLINNSISSNRLENLYYENEKKNDNNSFI